MISLHDINQSGVYIMHRCSGYYRVQVPMKNITALV